MSLKQNITSALRKTGLLGTSDRFRYLAQRIRLSGANRRFREKHPSFVFPPPYYIYETYRLNYEEYYNDGIGSARELIALAKRSGTVNPGDNWLDWGCGPARITRHIPGLLPGVHVYGTDYNPRYIAWCKAYITGINFDLNHISPPFHYSNDFFNVITGLSVFTHLSPEEHEAWIKELNRILRKGGVLIITTQGESYRNKLLPRERERFDNDQIVARAQIKQGHRLYSAFQPAPAMRRLLQGLFYVAELIEGRHDEDQDMWILVKE